MARKKESMPMVSVETLLWNKGKPSIQSVIFFGKIIWQSKEPLSCAWISEGHISGCLLQTGASHSCNGAQPNSGVLNWGQCWGWLYREPFFGGS